MCPVAKNQHVIPQNGRWVVKGEGNQRVTRITHSQREALKIAREIARNQGADVVIHGRDGKTRYDTYGTDPFPPLDLKH